MKDGQRGIGGFYPPEYLIGDPENQAPEKSGGKVEKINWRANLAGGLIVLLGSFVSSCNAEENSTDDTPSSPSTQAEEEELQNGKVYLRFPFPPHSDMNIQQGWIYNFENNLPDHDGIDFIKGKIDSSPWEPFPVLAPLGGFACKGHDPIYGNYIKIDHSSEGLNMTSWLGHVVEIDPKIPVNCNNSIEVETGEELATAGADGVQDEHGEEQPGWIHLHYFLLDHSVTDPKYDEIDPFDIRGERDLYPNPGFTNGKECGPHALFIECEENR